MSISGKAAFLLAVCVLAVNPNVSAQNHNNDWRQNGYGNRYGNGYGYGYGYGYAGWPQVVVAPPSVYVIAGGIYGTGVYVTPAATLPVQNTGISLSNDAGISLTAPFQTGVNTEVPATSGWSGGPAGYSYGAPVYGGQTLSPGDNGGDTGRLINDMGPSYYAGDSPGVEAAAPSLAEVAAQYKAAGVHNVRMYTNADAERIVSGVKTGSGSNQPVAPGSRPAQAPPATVPKK